MNKEKEFINPIDEDKITKIDVYEYLQELMYDESLAYDEAIT